jgi:hypothetical protein
MKRILFGCLCFILTACVNVVQPEPTPSTIVTPTPNPTDTVVWFPPTLTPTLIPTSQVTPTPESTAEYGEILYRDGFNFNRGWTVPSSQRGEINIGKGELNIIIREPKTSLSSILEDQTFGDFYAEITASPSLCSGKDEYGFMFRVAGGYYRYALSCDGHVQLLLVLDQGAVVLQPWMISSSVPTAAPSDVRLGVWAVGDEFRLYINDVYQFTVTNQEISEGNLGVFARSKGDTAVTVSFSNLTVRDVSP